MSFLTDLSVLINFSAVVQALILVVKLIRTSKIHNRLINIYLALVLFAMSVIIINSIRILLGYHQAFRIYENLSNSFILIIAPSLYLYIKSITGKSTNLKQIQLLPFLPFVLYLFVDVIIVNTLTNSILIDIWAATGIVLFVGQNIYYLTHSYILLSCHKKEMKSFFSYTRNVSLQWVVNILNGYTLTFILATFFILYQIMKGPIEPLINLNIVLIYSIHILVLSYKTLSRPLIIFRPDFFKEKHAQNIKTKKYFDQITQMVENEKLFLNPKLTLQNIADQLQIPRSYLSQAINQCSGSNFYDFINRYRVEEAKNNINDRSCQNLTLLAIAELSGFQSGSAFNDAFKKHTSMKPSEYRKRMLKL